MIVDSDIPRQMTIKLQDGGLACPNCRFAYGMHHGDVHTTAEGINIELECDHCDAKGMVLTIWQHKGMVLLSTRRLRQKTP